MEPIYVVLVIVIVIWIGVFGYLLSLDRQIKLLKKALEKLEKTGNN